MGDCNAKNESLLSSRTVPLVLRPPTPYHDEWLSHMALAPSRWPATRARIPATYNVSLAPLDSVTVAVQYALLQQSPQPSDFDALCKALDANVAALGGWAVDPKSRITYSHAYYGGQLFFEGPWDIECWAGVLPT